MSNPERHSLAGLAVESGVPVPCAGNLPLAMDDPQFVWFIEKGTIDLFLVEHRDGKEQSAPQHLMRADSGRLLLGVTPQAGNTTLSLIAKGLPNTLLRRLPITSLAAVRSAELAEHVDTWVMDVSTMLSRDVAPRPRPDVLVGPTQKPESRSGRLSAQRGVVWVSELTLGAGLFMSLIDAAQGKSGDSPATIALTPVSWLTLTEEMPLYARSSRTLAEESLLLPALAHFHSVAFSLERLNRRLAVVDQANLDRERATNRRADEEGARRRLFNLYGLLEPEEVGGSDSALLDVLRIIGRHEGIDFKWPARTDVAGTAAALSKVLDASAVRGRQVRLDQADRWWMSDSGAMLAFRKDDGRPVALLPGLLGHYREVDSLGCKTKVTPERAQSLCPEAWLFYPPLPSGVAGPRDLFRLARKRLTIDFVRFGLTGLLGGLIMLLPSVVAGFILNEVIPTGATSLLYSAIAALAALALIRALLHVLQGTTLMRLEGRATSRVEAAFWDRLLRLPLSCLHRYSAGDLAMRGMTFQNLRDTVQGVVANAVLSIVFLSPAFVLIYFYDARLGAITAAFGLLSFVVTIMLGLGQISPQSRATRTIHHLAGRLFQLINGISQLRVDGAEGSAFAVWARDYREQKLAELQRGTFETHLLAFGAALPLLAGAVLILAITLPPGHVTITAGDFFVVYLLFMLFLTGIARLGRSFSTVAAIMPALEQVRPFLIEPPEISVEGESVETLGGEIVFDHVSFHYDPDGPLILDDVSIHARPGEFIAIAGESGAGKSTLFRLALGLDQPSGGAVYYDGRDLKHLNVKQVRRQVGTVPQTVQLHPQDLWDNIVGDYEGATAKDTWHAAKLAAVDRDIAAMPMGMFTNVGASASVTSGGESQRITIAHALLRNPRILLLDEATNWLDNESQSKIMANLAGLSSTRIIIAHRLSTLRQVDRIYVMQAGKVVQDGTFKELVATEGVFRDLVRRQMA
ncbi:MAG: ATP-binding cassette domain-containing protein [Nitrospira sp. SB0677_bin_15]|nr:ATP-binding cassette domain-containing protein [Nitrospira sp. SB0677_bin_15]MYH01657.1 ATP-binding cassette domain-containing protein [Nitrospira sp. SB0675_bin_23]